MNALENTTCGCGCNRLREDEWEAAMLDWESRDFETDTCPEDGEQPVVSHSVTPGADP